jgi:aspartate aminotransferase-like enzyme
MLTFKIADSPREIAQLQALHYKTFVEEIPQHRPNEARRHVDRFHDENTYVVSLRGEEVIGSIAVRARRPFSLDAKLPDLDRYLPRDRRICEVRLLSIDEKHRTGVVLPGILAAFHDYAMAQQFDCAVISATTRQLKLYGQLGFEPFGPLVGTEEAQFQPMIVTLERFREHVRRLAALPPVMAGKAVSFLPGPVTVHADVAAAFAALPVSHRSPEFLEELEVVKRSLRSLTSSRHAAVLLGSGTLANDVVAAQLSLLAGARGLVVSNGEFGERLADHASRAGLRFEHLRYEWGQPIDVDAIRSRDADWTWLVACETSTGMLNPLPDVRRLCVDAVSAIGAIPLDFSRVWLATGASGKCLGSYPGLSFVFHNHDVAPSKTLPRYLDLGMYSEDVPFTHSSNLVHALRVALERVDWPSRYTELASTGAWLRKRLASSGFNVLEANAPHVVTIPVDDAPSLAAALARSGFHIAHASEYLRARNWAQLALMGEVGRAEAGAVVKEMARWRSTRADHSIGHSRISPIDGTTPS